MCAADRGGKAPAAQVLEEAVQLAPVGAERGVENLVQRGLAGVA